MLRKQFSQQSVVTQNENNTFLLISLAIIFLVVVSLSHTTVFCISLVINSVVFSLYIVLVGLFLIHSVLHHSVLWSFTLYILVVFHATQSIPAAIFAFLCAILFSSAGHTISPLLISFFQLLMLDPVSLLCSKFLSYAPNPMIFSSHLSLWHGPFPIICYTTLSFLVIVLFSFSIPLLQFSVHCNFV